MFSRSLLGHRAGARYASIGNTPSRASVVRSIERGSSFVTVTKNREDKWQKGEDVRVIEVKGDKFIRTDANKTEADNLGDLPTF